VTKVTGVDGGGGGWDGKEDSIEGSREVAAGREVVAGNDEESERSSAHIGGEVVVGEGEAGSGKSDEASSAGEGAADPEGVCAGGMLEVVKDAV
jgi:hypothetical protein